MILVNRISNTLLLIKYILTNNSTVALAGRNNVEFWQMQMLGPHIRGVPHISVMLECSESFGVKQPRLWR